MTVFNGQKYLAEALESVLAQTCKDFEFLIVDDGSTDRSGSILRDYAQRDSRIRIFFPGKLGLPAALNLLLREAKSEHVARMDSDDRMLPNRLERQLAFFAERTNLSVACSYAYFISGRGRRLGSSRTSIDLERGIRELRPELFLEFIHPTVMMRRSHILEAGGYDASFRYAEDRHLWGRLVTQGRGIACQPEFLLEYRLHSSAMTNSSSNRTQFTCLGIDTNIIRRLKGEPEFSPAELERWYRNLPLWERLRRHTRFLATQNFQNASRFYADQRYARFFLALASAMALRPLAVINRLAVRLR